MSLPIAVLRILLPDFKTGHTKYVDKVKELFSDNCRWLDAGGGRRIFPDEYDGERDLVLRASSVTVCDVDQSSLDDHISVKNKICCDLSSIPLESSSIDLITCGMVVEHLADPKQVIIELGRLLDDRGKLVIHTVNIYGYPTLISIASKWMPFRKKLISFITGREVCDIFPTFYRCNTERRLRHYLEIAGLKISEFQHVDAGILFKRIWPLAVFECLWLRLTKGGSLEKLRGQLLVVATKTK